MFERHGPVPLTGRAPLLVSVALLLISSGLTLAFDPGRDKDLAKGPETGLSPPLLHVLPGSCSNRAVRNISVGSYPMGIAYDPVNGNVYVATWGEGTSGGLVKVISGTSGNVVASVRVGHGPLGIATDTINGDLYVTNSLDGNVTVIDGSTNAALTSIPAGGSPYGIAFDPVNGYLYVADSLNTGGSTPPFVSPSTNLTVIDASTNRAVGSITVGVNPIDVLYDSTSGDILAINSGTASVFNVSVVNVSVGRSVRAISLDGSPGGAALDSQAGYLYVTDAFQDLVHVINVSSGIVVASIPVGENPSGAVIDPQDQRLYVANYNTANLTVISEKTQKVVGSIPVGTYPFRGAYDPANGNVYFTNIGSANVSVITVAQSSQPPTPSYSVYIETCLAIGASVVVILLIRRIRGREAKQQPRFSPPAS